MTLLPPSRASLAAAALLTVSLAASGQASNSNKTQAADAYLTGARQLDRHDFAAAEKSFAHAADLAPGDPTYTRAAALAREHHVTDLVQRAGRARLANDAPTAERLLAEARTLAPDSDMVRQHEAIAPAAPSTPPWLAAPPVYAGAIALSPSPKRLSFHLHTDSQDALRQVASGFGLRATFDASAEHKPLRFDLDDVTYTEAMPILLQMAQLFATPLEPTSLLLAKDTPENHMRLDRLLEETVYLPAGTTEQLTDLGNVVRNVFDVRQASVQNGLNNLVIRAPEETLRAVNLTLAGLLDDDAEVLLELKLYSVDTLHQRNTGVTLPNQIGAYNLASQAQALVTANQTVVNQAIAQGLIPATASILQIAEYLLASGIATSALLTNTLGVFGGGLTLTGVYATGGVSLNLALTTSDARALDEVQLRVGDRHEGTFRVGSRYPITTSTYSSGITANRSSLAGVTINGVSASTLLSQLTGGGSTATVPQIQYEDLGLTFKATPTILKTGAVNLKMDFRVEALAGGANDNIPILANRQLVSDITVNDGETAMILSNMNRSEARALNGLPGLSELPGFQSATEQTREADTSQLVLLLTPHIVRRRPNLTAGPRIAFAPMRTGN